MHPNAQVVVRGFQAFDERDMAGVKDVFANDLIWHTGGNNRWSGTHHGADTVVRLFQDIVDHAEVTNEVHAVLADDDHVVVLAKGTTKRAGKSHAGDTVFVFHVSDGKVTEAWSIPQDPYGLDEFWTD